MLFAKSKILTGVVACAMSLSLLAPPAVAADRQVISEGHADAFFIDTSDGSPVVHVNHGIRNTKYDPNTVSFAISASAYGDYDVFSPYLDRGHVGYYSASEDGDYFEPGWSAPSYRDNGFTSVRIDFTQVDGPGDVAVLGNRLVDTEPFAKYLISSDRLNDLSPLIDSLTDSDAVREFGIQGIPNGTYYLDEGTSLPVFGHTHAHWFFNASGHYEITGKAVGVKTDGSVVESDPFTTVFEVEDASSANGEAESSDGDDVTDEEEPAATDSPSTPDQRRDQVEGKKSGYAPLSNPVTFNSGHMDAFYIGTPGGTPQLLLKEDVTAASPTARVPSSVTMVFGKERYEQTGNFNGSIEETAGYHSNASGRGWTVFSPGWSIDSFYENGFSKAEVHFTSVKGPGRIVLTSVPSLEGTLRPVLTNSSPYLTTGAVLPVSGHTHGYWLFTRPGTYTIEAKAVATKKDGSGVLESPVETYTFVVEPNPADPSASEGDNPPQDRPTPNAPEDSDETEEPESDEPTLVVKTPGDKIAAGADLNAAVSGFVPGAQLEVGLRSLFAPFTQTTVVPKVIADDRGNADFTFTVPSEFKPGMYNLSAGPIGKDPEAFAVVNIAASSSPSVPDSPDTDQPQEPNHPSPGEGPSPKDIVDSNDAVEIDHGHLDLLTAIVKDRALYVVVKDDSTGKPVLRDPADVTLRVRENALTTIGKGIAPNLPEKGYFLDAGGLKQQEMLFPGWDTNGVRPDYGEVDFEIVKMSAPKGAHAFMFNTKSFGGVEPAFTNGELEIKDGAVIHQDRPAHVHTNWLFSAPGVYTMEVRATAKPINGSGDITSRTVTYTWKVGEETSAPQQETPDVDAPNNNASQPHVPALPESPQASPNPPATSVPTPRSSAAPSVAKAKCFPKTEGGTGADTLLPRIKDDRTSPGTWVDPTTMTFSIGDAGKATTPMDIGAVAQGTDVWMISMSQVKGVPWIGVNTQHPSLSETTQGPTTFSLTSFSGPGKLEVFEFGRGLSPTVGKIWFSGANGTASGSMSIEPNTHVHPNWIFTEPGRYELGITMTTQAKDGSELSGSTVLTIDVGSDGGINDGHFDLGPTIGAAGSRTVWVDANGKPCTPDANDLAAAGLAKTGANGIDGIQMAVLSLAFIGTMMLVLRRRSMIRLRH